MKLIYKAKWPIVILFAITFVASFAALFVGETAVVNNGPRPRPTAIYYGSYS